jgi:hypothetical protein
MDCTITVDDPLCRWMAAAVCKPKQTVWPGWQLPVLNQHMTDGLMTQSIELQTG